MKYKKLQCAAILYATSLCLSLILFTKEKSKFLIKKRLHDFNMQWVKKSKHCLPSICLSVLFTPHLCLVWQSDWWNNKRLFVTYWTL